MFFGWKVVAVAFMVAFFGFGIGFYGPGVYLVALHQLHGWPIALVSFAITGYYVLGASLVVFAGDAFDRFGPRKVLLFAMSALALGVLGLAGLSRPWQLYAAFGVMAFGWAGMGGAAINVIVAPWFEKRRGLAVSMALNGASFGGAVMTPLWIVLIATLGFQSAALVVAGAMAVILIPLIALYLPRGPAELGLRPDGILTGDGNVPGNPERPSTTLPASRRSELVRSARFWTISAPFALALFAQVGFLTHQVSYLTPRLGTHGAAVAVSLTTCAAIIGRIVAGVVIDRVDRRGASAGNFLVQAVAITVMIASSSPFACYVACVLFGLGLGNVTSFPALIVQTDYPKDHFSRVVSLIVAINQFTFAFGPGIIGWARDSWGSYSAALGLCVACQTVAATVVLIRPRH
jgi:MFS family permease